MTDSIEQAAAETEVVDIEAVETVNQQNQEFQNFVNMVTSMPLFAKGALRISIIGGQKRIGATIFGRRGSVGVSLREVEKSKRYAVTVSPHHKYEGRTPFPHFPYFIPCDELSAINLITKVAIAIHEAE